VVWVGGDKGLSRLRDGRFQTITASQGLPERPVIEIMDDDVGNLWLGLQIYGFLRINRAEAALAMDHPDHRLGYTVYNAATGIAGAPDAFLSSSAARHPDGPLWFVTGRGVTIVDPRTLQDDKGVVIGNPRIEGVAVGDRWTKAVSGAIVPPRPSRLRIDYGIVNLSSFDETRFRYRLDGFDSNWVDGTGRRQAQYTNLPPGEFTFRLQAARPAGLWEDSEVTWSFSIAPTFYQTSWFYSASVVAFGLTVAGAWRLRMRQVRKQMTAVLNERSRLSREIHDTLLQGLGGVALQLDVASSEVARSPSNARASLIRTRRQVEEYMREARQSIWDLRSPALESRDIVTALREAATRLTSGKVSFALEVDGTPRTCESRVETQILRIAQEALVNAVRYANAQHVAIRLNFGAKGFRMSVADDGRGFDPAAVAGRSGHFGLIGMQERAAEVGGRCTIESAPGRGTLVVAEFPLSR
jgi:signal transduction histidine kinase